MYVISAQGDNSYAPFINYGSIAGISPSAQSSVTQYPLEEGSFTCVNKSAAPISLQAKILISGDSAGIISELEKYRKSTDLFVVVTPEYRYRNMSLVSYSYTRGNASMLEISLDFQEVLQACSGIETAYLPKNAGDASIADTGVGRTLSVASSAFRKIYYRGV